jgi:hypothetical protein
MSAEERAIRRIDAVLNADLAPDLAYPLRARLGRAVNEVAAALVLANASDTAESSVAAALRRLRASADRIMQPSEPFDALWRGQWSGVIEDLRLLRQVLSGFATRDD